MCIRDRAMVDALTFVRDIRAKYDLGEAGMDYDIASQLFKQKKAAMILNGAWSWKEYEDAGINLGVAPMPVSYTHLDVYKRQEEMCLK